MARNVYLLADRWHQTPARIRREVTVEDLMHVLELDRILEEERNAQ